MHGGCGPVVVKLGGSFAFTTHLRDWLAALATCAGRVVIVPGGGLFADAVRTAQPRMGFDDGTAHHMALLAMEQYGRALVALNASLSPAESAEAIRRDLTAQRVPVWMPTRMVLGATDIAPSWDTTSDSLAAWLAGEIGAARLMILKHGEFRSGAARFDELAAMGIVDKAFAQQVRTSGVDTFVFGPEEQSAALDAVRNGGPAGVALV